MVAAAIVLAHDRNASRARSVKHAALVDLRTIEEISLGARLAPRWREMLASVVSARDLPEQTRIMRDVQTLIRQDPSSINRGYRIERTHWNHVSTTAIAASVDVTLSEAFLTRTGWQEEDSRHWVTLVPEDGTWKIDGERSRRLDFSF